MIDAPSKVEHITRTFFFLASCDDRITKTDKYYTDQQCLMGTNVDEICYICRIIRVTQKKKEKK
jgi:hypothetical protein